MNRFMIGDFLVYLGYLKEKWVTAVTQPFVNLKSNTMKNTLQRYAENGISSKHFYEKVEK